MELYAGYSKYRRLGFRQSVQRFLPHPLSSALVAGMRPVFGGTDWFRHKMAPYGADPATMVMDTLNTGFSFPELRAAARGPLAQALKSYHPADTVLPLLRKAPVKEVGLVNSMRYLDLKMTLAGDMLVKVDRASMAVSLEVRPVYLHREMLDLAGRIPAGLLADRTECKKLLKSSLRPWLPDSVLYRKKMGFALPLKEWIRTDLNDLMICTGSDPANELLDHTLLNKLSHAQSFGKADLMYRIHSIFFLKHWFAAWLQ